MPHAPIGYLIGSVVTAAITYLSLWPRPTNGPRATPTSVLAMAGSELPHIFLLLNATSTTLAITEGAPFSIVGGVALALSSLAAIGQVAVIVLASRGRAAISDSLAAAYGDVGLSRSPGWRHWLRAALAPARLRRRSVERTSAIRYGPDRAAHLLDLYRARDLKAAKGFVIHFHGGGFFSGRRSKEARLLMEQLAAAGWIGISADYRLEPAVFPDQVVDAKRVLAWTREHARDYGADPETVVLVGGSAGAHIATICALTAGDPRFQPGFEDADTRVSAVIGLYGYYGPAPTRGLPSAPEDYLSEATGRTSSVDIPPTLIVHGDRDPMVAPAMARRMAEQLRDASADQVVYVELPGGHHTLDRFDSLRCSALTDGVDDFLQRALG